MLGSNLQSRDRTVLSVGKRDVALNKVAAAYLAYFAYIDDALETVQASDFVTLLASIPAGAANGPWTLRWGPAANDGILGYVAQGADGSYALAFRGTDVDGSISGSFQNVLADANGFFLIPWLYPQQSGAPLQISAGINGALALAIGMTDPTTSISLLDYLRGVAKAGTLDLIVTGHSLAGALAIGATAWLHNQLPKVGTLSFSLWPHTFAAPTMWNAGFATNIAQTFTCYAAVNGNDIVPMGWADLNGVLATFPSPGPNLYDTDFWLYWTIDGVSKAIPTYTAIVPSDADTFTVTPVANESWTVEAGTMHSMQFQYFPHATGTAAPPLPGTTRTGLARTRVATPT
jgi:Lipase (class 3)